MESVYREREIVCFEIERERESACVSSDRERVCGEIERGVCKDREGECAWREKER